VPTLVPATAVGADLIAAPQLRLIVVWKIIAMETEHVLLRTLVLVIQDGRETPAVGHIPVMQ